MRTFLLLAVRRASSVAVLMSLCLSACGAENAPEGATSKTAASMRTNADGSTSGSGAWEGPDGRSTITALFRSGQLAQIDEFATLTDGSRATRQFQFDSAGALTAAREEKELLVYGATAQPDTVRSVLTAAWSAGATANSSKTVNSETKTVQPFELENLSRHAAELLPIARSLGPTSP
jgi:hypothetical protein